MPSDRPEIRFLLDERYPGWLAEALTAEGVDTVALTARRAELRGLDDGAVLEAAVKEGRIVVTEDVTTFAAAIMLVPDHVGVVSSHHARYPRTRPGLQRLRRARADPPAGLGEHPIEWWLPAPDDA
ncbi:MAG: DUF5615 family PIN-like protein [Egibacteraceae bacterium]